jgi:2'-5' RNA ligase
MWFAPFRGDCVSPYTQVVAATAVIVPIPEADPLVGGWRRRHTEDGRDGMPAHVTLLYPFVEEAGFREDHLSRLAAALASFGPAEVRFDRFDRFAGPPVPLYLVPEPADPFRAMTEAIVLRFPDHPPYEGAFDSVVPHLTVVQTDDEAVLAEAERDVTYHLPIVALAERVLVMAYDAGRGWQPRWALPLTGS